MNECSPSSYDYKNPCDENATCTNYSIDSGRYTCKCKDGYTGTGYGSGSCKNLNECNGEGGGHKCDPGKADCKDWEARTPTSQDRNKWETSNRNEWVKYECICKDGYRNYRYADTYNKKGRTNNCIAINECTDETDKHDCDVNATCKNETPALYASYIHKSHKWTCTCKDGFTGDGTKCEGN